MNRFKVKTSVPVRFSDTDAMGHVNNACYFSYMEEGRTEYFKRLFGEGKIQDAFKLFPFILADIQCSFKSPVFVSECLTVALGVTEIRNKSFVMDYDMHEEKTGRLVGTGKSVLVMYDYDTHQSRAIPAEFKQRIEELEGRSLSHDDQI